MSCLQKCPIAYSNIFIDTFYIVAPSLLFQYNMHRCESKYEIPPKRKRENQVYHFIVNPNSRSGLGRKVWNEIEVVLKDQQINYQVYFTEYQRHATKIVESLTSDGLEHTLVILGGDGTISEVLTGIIHPEKITLGYIPIGSGNDFARGLGLPKEPRKALDMVLHSNRRRKLDLGVLKYGNKARRFGVSSGFGFDAAICYEICVSPVKKFLNKLHFGKLSYVIISIHCLFRCTPTPMTITLDEKKKLEFKKTYFATAMNLPYEGGGCKFCPKASARDGLLDIIVISDVSKFHALLIIPTVFFGLHTLSSGVHIYRCKKAKFQSDIPLPVHADGEPIFLQKALALQIDDSQIDLIIE